MPTQPVDWKPRQRRLNAFTGKYLRGVGPIRVDGELGPSTKKRLKECQWWLGWEKSDGRWNDKLDKALIHPLDPSVTSKGTVARGKKRRRAHNLGHLKSYLKPGVGTFDGVRVAKVAIPLLQWCRANAWPGHLVSGYRDPAYSQRLCYAMCGRPSCPGRCAGLSSNHVGSSPARFAIDVSDYVAFGKVIAKCPLKPKIFNGLGVQDPVHWSPSGR